MSLKTMLEILKTGIRKKINQAKKLRELHQNDTGKGMYHYYDGRIDALCEVLQELELTCKAVQEEGI